MKIPKLIAIIFSLIMFFETASAENPKCKLSVTNPTYTSKSSLEFEIYLLNTSKSEDLKYSLGQYVFSFNKNIANGGKLTCSIVTSGLPENLIPGPASVLSDKLRLAANSVSLDRISLPVISKEGKGTMIAKVKIHTSADKFSEEPLELKWSKPNDGIHTKLFAFAKDSHVELTDYIDYTIDDIVNIKTGVEPVTVEQFSNAKIDYELMQNYPNPFNPSTVIKFNLEKSGLVKLIVYDITGRSIETLVDKELLPGSYQYKFDGSKLASGIYFYKFSFSGSSGQINKIMKMTLLK